MMRGRIFGLLVGIVVIAGCGGDEPTERVTISVGGARWMAVRTADEPWVRVDAPVHRIETAGWFEVAVVCREDVGDGWTWLATTADRPEDEDGVWEASCDDPPAGATATAIFDVVGRVDYIHIGGRWTSGPDYFSVELAPGVYDVVAVRNRLDRSAAERIQILRGVRVDGTTRIPIDVEARGEAAGEVTVEVNGLWANFMSHIAYTAGGTAFRLDGGGWRQPAMPPALRIEGDREYVDTLLPGAGWIKVEVRHGTNIIRADLPAFESSWGDDELAVSWRSDEPWEWVRLSASTEVNGQITYPRWAGYAWPGALAARTIEGETTFAFTAPQVAGWGPDWLPDPAAPHRRTATWSRPRADGWEGYRISTQFNEPEPPPVR